MSNGGHTERIESCRKNARIARVAIPKAVEPAKSGADYAHWNRMELRGIGTSVPHRPGGEGRDYKK